ncbi:MAG: HEPN domain-containing protein [Thermoplasmata archaeon]
MNEEAETWWKQALKDLDTARQLLGMDNYEGAAFFAQQSAEKGLKALHIDRFRELKKTHDLVLLARDLGLPKRLIDLCKELSPAYIYTRYPDVVPVENVEKVSKELLGYAEEIVRWIEGRR